MDLSIKNTVKIVIFFFLLMTPFWIARTFLVLLNPELAIGDWLNYLFVSLRFDLKAASIWYSPLYIVLAFGLVFPHNYIHKVAKVLFVFAYLAALTFGLIAVFYFPISKNINGIELFQLVQGQEPRVIFGYIKNYWVAILGAVGIGCLALQLYKKTKVELNRMPALLACIVGLLVLAFFARGGVALKPLNLLDAYAQLDEKEAISAVTPTYVLIESIGKKELEVLSYFNDEVLEESLALDHIKLQQLSIEQPNICLILLESFGKEYTGYNLSERPSYTPFLDSLAEHSVYYTNAYANGLRSIDAVTSTLTGIPALMKQPFIGSLYTYNDVNSVPEVLDSLGYYTSFYHAADELSMGFKPFLLSKGLDKYYGKQQYPSMNDFDGTWGIFDEPFLSFCADELSNQQQPWMSGVFTLSSHHPYAIPQRYAGLPKGTSEIHQSVGYTDNALRMFFKKAATMPWFENTIFIITADHTSINQTPTYSTYRGKYEVPLMLYAPKFFAPKEIEQLAQHIDIAPTIKHLAGLKETVSLGTSLLDSIATDVVLYDGNIYMLTNDSLTLQWNGVSEYKLFHYINDREQRINVANKYKVEGEQMFNALKLQLQKYNYRMLNNDFK